MGLFLRRFLTLLWFSSVLSFSDARADHGACESVCGGQETFEKSHLKSQIETLFFKKSACNSIPTEESTLTESSRSLALGAWAAGAVLTRSCQLTQEMKPALQAEMLKQGSAGFVSRALKSAGLVESARCLTLQGMDSELTAGDVLKIGNQSIILDSVSKDPFSYQAHLENDLTSSIRKERSLDRAFLKLEAQCQEWTSDSRQYQISLIFLSFKDSSRAELKHGSWHSLMGGDQGTGMWNTLLQERAVHRCLMDGLGRLGFKKLPASLKVQNSLKVFRPKVQDPECRIHSENTFQMDGGTCAQCCLDEMRRERK